MVMRKSTRSRILDYLRKQQTASALELSRLLAMTGANIRHHLAVLESNGLIECIRQQREGRGRPVNIYGLSRQFLGDGQGELAGAILNVWLKNAPEAVFNARLRSVAILLVGDNLPGHEVLLTQRLNSLVDRLNTLHYQARWEAGVNGPNVILGYCPYAAIIAAHPELCLMDEFLLAQWTGFPIEPTAILQTGIKGYPACTFRITGSR
jgi:predicted ArsR family transcriptional regulator